MPQGLVRPSDGQSPNAYGPSPMQMSTPSDIVAATPPGNGTQPLMNASSPVTKLQNMKILVDRAHMFVEGRYGEMVKSMREEEKS
jgi:hypothetical protein